MDHHHGAGELGTLGFVDGERIGELQVLKVGRPFSSSTGTPSKSMTRCRSEDIDHIADGTVHHVQVVVVRVWITLSCQKRRRRMATAAAVPRWIRCILVHFGAERPLWVGVSTCTS